MMKRRDFFNGLAAGAVLLGSGTAALAQVDTLVNLSQSHMQAIKARLGQLFALQCVTTRNHYQAQLQSVDSAGRDEQFYLRFELREPEELSEDLYLLTARDGDEMLLHLMPSVSNGRAMEAVINLRTA